MTNGKSTCTSVVVRGGLSWFAAAGTHTTFHATPEWARQQLSRVVLTAQQTWFRGRSEGTVLWQGVAGIGDDRLSVGANDMLTSLRDRGCTVSDAGLETGWFSVFRDGFATVHLGIGPMIPQDQSPFGNLASTDAKDLAERLARYADVTGAAWRGHAGLAGCAAIRAIHEAKDNQPLWHWKVPAEPGLTGCSYELGRVSKRLMEQADWDAPWVHQFDIRAMYLAAAGVGMFGWSAPEHDGPREFDPSLAGYWQVRCDEVPHKWGRGTVTRVTEAEGLMWVTTPVLAFLYEKGVQPEVFGAYTSKRTGRYLREWATRLTGARAHLDQLPGNDRDRAVLAAVKDTYTKTSGMMARSGGRIYRPDWRDTIVDTARINLIRKVDKAGFSPLRYNVDSVWIASSLPVQEIEAKLGTLHNADGIEVPQVGKFRCVASQTISEYQRRYER